jgi:hypothetical protein
MSPFCNLTSLSSVDIKKRNQLSYLRYLRETKKFDFLQKNELFVKIF